VSRQPGAAGVAAKAPRGASSTPPLHELWARGFGAWERAAAEAARTMVSDPRTLELGAAMLRTHLLWRSAFNDAFAAALAPFGAGDGRTS
jgi:hypothetical protein